MTNIPTLRAVLPRVESLKGPLTRGEAEKVADKLFMLSTDRESWLDVVAALGGGRSALGAVVALVEREMPEWVIANLGQDDNRLWWAEMRWGHQTSFRQAVISKLKMPSPALALLAAYLRALIAETEQAGQRAGKAS